jgi:hypothetical protein
MIAVEFFRFESWLQQSGLLAIDPTTGSLEVHEMSLRRCLLLAAEMQSTTMAYDQVERHVLTIIGQAYHCLQELEKLRSKYSIGPSSENQSSIGITKYPSAISPAEASAPGAQPLFRNSRIATALAHDVISRQRRAKMVSFFRKVNFSWSLSDDTSDKDKLLAHVQTLKYCNDALRECLPPMDREQADKLANIKALSLSSDASDLKSIGTAITEFDGQIYRQIYDSVMLKARRVEESSYSLQRLDMEIEIARVSGLEPPSDNSQPSETIIPRTILKYSDSRYLCLLRGSSIK